MLTHEHRPAVPAADAARREAPGPQAGDPLMRSLGNAQLQLLAETEELDGCGCGCTTGRVDCRG
jgi:hypothetical protein